MSEMNPYQPPAPVAEPVAAAANAGHFNTSGRTLDASHGWNWISSAFTLFMKQPGMWILLFIIYFVCCALLSAIPILGGFANLLSQIRSILSQPAVKRSLPLIFMVGLIGAAALAWMALATPPQRVLFASLPESDKAAVAEALSAASIPNAIDGAGSLTVGEDDYHKARMLVAGQGLPKAAPGGYALLDQLPMGVSRAVEGERLRQARETELARSISEIDTVAEARVHLATPEATVFVRDKRSEERRVGKE